jgi:mRNA-degrading endonuclease RelE of RelBE toxin-antitoxin system
VTAHPKVVKDLSEYRLTNPDFRPTFAALIAELQRNPKQFPKKSGQLRTLRAASLRYRETAAWRLVFQVDEHLREVYIVSVGPHDEAYEVAVRRSRIRSVT